MELNDPSWLESVFERRLLADGRRTLAADAADAEAAAAVATCEAIGVQVLDELERVRARAANAGFLFQLEAAQDGGDQIHALRAHVADFDQALALAEALGRDGYRRWEPWTGGARESFRRMSSVLTVARTDERTYVVNIGWDSVSKLGRMPGVLRPNEADWSFVKLPKPLWFLYFLVRPMRLIGEKLGVFSKGAGHLGPFLATPESLLDPLFDFAEVGVDDVVVDLGCGDGRLVIEAARRRGCRGRGIETDAELVERARSAAAEAGLSDRVEIVEGDAASIGIGDATVVFVFLPADVAGSLIPEIVAGLTPGVRVVAHEQHRIHSAIAPSRSTVLVGDGAVTVAHRWSS